MSQVTSNPPDAFQMNVTCAPTALEDKTNILSRSTYTSNPATVNEKNKIADTPQISQNNCSEQDELMHYSETYSKTSESSRENNKKCKKRKSAKCKDEPSAMEITNEFPIYIEKGIGDNNTSHYKERIQNAKIKIKDAKAVSNLEEDDKLKIPCSDVLPDNINEDIKNIGKSRPISMKQIPGTKWCVVWTDDRKVFFYDAYCKISVWNTPDELIYRADVKKISGLPPTAISEKIDSSGSGATKIEVENTPAVSEYPLNTLVEEPTIQEMVLQATKEREAIPHEIRVQMFMNLLSEKKVSAFSAWEKELHKIVFDSRYLLLTPKERKRKFEEYVLAKVEEEKNRKRREIATIKENYTLLLEEAGVSHNTRFSDFTHKYCKDSRFQAIDRTKERERLFNMFIRDLRRTASQNSTYSKQPSRFFELLKEQDFLNASSTWYECKKKIAGDDRYLAVSSEEHRENLFKDFIRNYFHRSLSKEKEERIVDSIETRRKEVQKNMAVCMKDAEEGRRLYKYDSLTNCFMALLVDLVKSPDLKYRDAIRFLKEDHRWETVSDLRSSEREKLFDYHIRQLKTRKTEHFYKLLDELLKEIDLTSTWKDVKKTILMNERCSKIFSEEKECEREFNDYMKNRLKTAKDNFQHLLKETKIITYDTKDFIKNKKHLEYIETVLAKDKRYLVLKCVESDRKKILLSHIDDLHIQGPPPPPTASEPSRR